MNWSGPRFTLDDVDGSEEISRYFVNFPGEQDFGLVDYADDIVRAVTWLVFLPAESPGYGYVDTDTPELCITTFDGFQGIGVGTDLLNRLIASARDRGLGAISLSVEDGNRSRHLYERIGFTVVDRNGGSDTMLLTLN